MTTLPADFTVFPAIDLRHGRVVRLAQGRDDARSDYGLDPVEVARSFQAAGARALHLVDLDAAFGDGDNRAVIARVLDAVDLPVQVGGGVRSDEAFEALASLGVAAAIIGSAAVEDPSWVGRLVERWGDRVIVGIDARDGDVKLRD
jgi:phosphoribosylformimino-5-aminoimidazole carboxamide ribotide isomerase